MSSGTGDGRPEYVEAMWLMLRAVEPRDYVICTGETHSLREFIAAAFMAVGLNSEGPVVMDETLFRPTDILVSRGSPARPRQSCRGGRRTGCAMWSGSWLKQSLNMARGVLAGAGAVER